VKALTIPLTADTVFRVVSASRHATRGHVTHSPGTMQALSRLGGDPQGVMAVPLILRDKVAAVLYCDTPQDEVPPSAGDVIEILVSYAGKVIDVLSAQPRAGGPAPAPGGTSPAMRPPAAAAPQAPVAESSPRGFSPEGGTMRAQPAATVYRPPTAPTGGRLPAPPPAPPTPGPRGLPPEEQKAHDDAKRFARLVVSEIKLYNEAKVTEGRKTKDIYERLKEDIERGRQMYHDRVSASVRDASDYFQDELVRILAGGDANALGSM